MSASPFTIHTRLVATDWRELASRENDGLEVSLLWSKSAGRVKVAVADLKRDEAFELDVPGADALAAFHHPFAFAAGRGFAHALRESTEPPAAELRGESARHP